MKALNRWMPLFGIILLALALSAAATFMPWWTVRTTPVAEYAQDSTSKAEYRFYETVIASNQTHSVTVPFRNLSKSDDVNDISLVFNTTYTLTIAGILMVFLTLGLVILAYFDKTSLFFSEMAAVATAFILLAAPLNLAFYLPLTVQTLDQIVPRIVLPENPPESWISITPKKINGFWGTLTVPESPSFPEWSWNTAFWNWGAAFGWHLQFIASILFFGATVWIHSVIAKRKE